MHAVNVSGRMKLFGALAVVFGFLASTSPWAAGQSVMWLFGALVIAAGSMRMIFMGFPIAGTVAIGVFLGIELLLVGFSMFMPGSAAKAQV